MELRSKLNLPRTLLTTTALISALVALLLPLDRHVSVPGVLLAEQQAWIYPSENAEIISVHAKPGDQVKKGDLLLQLSVSDIENKLDLTALRQAVIEEKMSRIAANAKDRAQVTILQRDLETAQREIEGLKQRRQLLRITAPWDGIVASHDKPLHAGMWVGQQDLLFHVFSSKSAVMAGLVVEREVGRIKRDAEATFIAEDGTRAARLGHVTAIGMPGGEGIVQKYLSSQFGGAIEMPMPSGENQVAKSSGHLPIAFAVEGESAETVLVGTIIVDATPQSILGYAFGRLVTVALRESGF